MNWALNLAGYGNAVKNQNHHHHHHHHHHQQQQRRVGLKLSFYCICSKPHPRYTHTIPSVTCHTGLAAISFPESSFPLASGPKTKALGATISGMRHTCRLRSETDGHNSVISKWLLPEPSFSDRLSRRTKTLKTRSVWRQTSCLERVTIFSPRER